MSNHASKPAGIRGAGGLKSAIQSDQSQLLIIDVQERLVAAMPDTPRFLPNIGILMKAGSLLSIPITVTEQYPKGLGPSAPIVRLFANSANSYEKLSFSCLRTPEISDHLARITRPQVVVCGLEAHVCVVQTSFDLRDAGYRVFVVADAVQSRQEENRRLALDRMRAEDIAIVSTEMVIFEWLEKAGTSQFKDIAPLVR